MMFDGKVSGSSVTYDTNTSATSDEDTWHDVGVLCDGGDRGDTSGNRGWKQGQFLMMPCLPD